MSYVCYTDYHGFIERESCRSNIQPHEPLIHGSATLLQGFATYSTIVDTGQHRLDPCSLFSVQLSFGYAELGTRCSIPQENKTWGQWKLGKALDPGYWLRSGCCDCAYEGGGL